MPSPDRRAAHGFAGHHSRGDGTCHHNPVISNNNLTAMGKYRQNTANPLDRLGPEERAILRLEGISREVSAACDAWLAERWLSFRPFRTAGHSRGTTLVMPTSPPRRRFISLARSPRLPAV